MPLCPYVQAFHARAALQLYLRAIGEVEWRASDPPRKFWEVRDALGGCFESTSLHVLLWCPVLIESGRHSSC
jgi:hypothetical protein